MSGPISVRCTRLAAKWSLRLWKFVVLAGSARPRIIPRADLESKRHSSSWSTNLVQGYVSRFPVLVDGWVTHDLPFAAASMTGSWPEQSCIAFKHDGRSTRGCARAGGLVSHVSEWIMGEAVRFLKGLPGRTARAGAGVQQAGKGSGQQGREA